MITLWLPGPGRCQRRFEPIGCPYLKALAALHEESLVAAVRHQVPLDHAVRGADRLDSDVGVVPEGAVQDADVTRVEYADPGALAGGRAIAGAVSDQDSGGAEELDADVRVPRRGNAEQAVVPCLPEVDAAAELRAASRASP